jgi:hypothetical protein
MVVGTWPSQFISSKPLECTDSLLLPQGHTQGRLGIQVAETSPSWAFPASVQCPQAGRHKTTGLYQHLQQPHPGTSHLPSLEAGRCGAITVDFLVLLLGWAHNHTMEPLPSCLGAMGPLSEQTTPLPPTWSAARTATMVPVYINNDSRKDTGELHVCCLAGHFHLPKGPLGRNQGFERVRGLAPDHLADPKLPAPGTLKMPLCGTVSDRLK